MTSTISEDTVKIPDTGGGDKPPDRDSAAWWDAWSQAVRDAPVWGESEFVLPEVPPHRAAWATLVERHDILRRGAPTWNEPVPPKPYSPAEVARLASTLLHPDSRDALREALLLVIGEDIGKLVATMCRQLAGRG